MTATQLKEYFLTEYDAATSLAGPGWEDDEISNFLNIAQDSLVTELYKVGDLTKLAEIIHTNANLVCAAHPNIVNGVYFTVASINTTGEFFHYIDSRTYLSRTNPTIVDDWIPNEVIDRKNASKFYLTVFNNVWFKYPKIFMDAFDDSIDTNPKYVILLDSYTNPNVTLAELTYIKRPVRIDITAVTTTDLNESLHQTIVSLAVQEALKAIKVTKVATQ